MRMYIYVLLISGTHVPRVQAPDVPLQPSIVPSPPYDREPAPPCAQPPLRLAGWARAPLVRPTLGLAISRAAGCMPMSSLHLTVDRPGADTTSLRSGTVPARYAVLLRPATGREQHNAKTNIASQVKSS
jgi:hypothetical protein